jgi:hypothetical protein
MLRIITEFKDVTERTHKLSDSQLVFRLFVVNKFLLACQPLNVLESAEVRALIRDEDGMKGYRVVENK